ncbi:MAG TPA: TonB-dependent receptor [Vicinamibacterales bacterium]|nr:TonB-dependent receptor [Vicinamibacterales bacterium]
MIRAMGRGLLVVVLVLGTALAGAAQTSTGGLRGFVRDNSGLVMAGVTVEASSPARIGGAAVAVTDAQGLYTFANLPIGNYAMVFTLQGFTSVRREDIRVEVGRTIQVDVSLEVGNLQESVTVTGSSPVVDAANAGFSTNFNQELLQNVPTARQSYFDVVTFAPSVRINQVPNDSRFIIFGSSSDQNQFQYDGVDISAVSNGGVWDFPSPDIMQEVQVKAIGASAEFHSFQGGVVNIVTKSGSNQFRGMGSAYFIPGDWVANNTPNEQFPYTVHYNQQGTGELGGPIKRDRIWFYGLLTATRQLTTGVGVDPNTEKAGGRNFKPFVKATWRPSENGNLSIGFNNNNFCCAAAASRTAPLITQTVEHGHNPVIYSQYTHSFGSATLLEVRGGGIYIRDNFTPYSDDFETPGRTDQSTGVSSVNGQTASKQFHNRTTLDASLANTRSWLGGTHDLKTGIQTTYGTQRTVGIRIGGVSYTDLSTAAYRATYSEPSATGGRIRTFGLYGQDTWTVNDALTLNLGLRFDNVRGDVPEMTSEATLDGIKGASFSPPVVSYPGIPDLISFNTLAPRAGLTYRVGKSGRTVLKSGYGRFYGKLTSLMFSGTSPGGAVTYVREINPATGQYEIPVSVTDPKLNFAVDGGLNNQYTDQFSVGVEQQVADRTGIAVSFVYKNEGDFIRLQDRRGAYVPRDIVDTFEGNSQTITVQNLTSGVGSQLFTVVNRGDFDQSFKSVVVEVNRRFSNNIQAQSSYTWQDSKAFGSGSVTGSTQQDFSNLSPTAGYGRDPNDTLNAFGPTATNATHAVKLSATYAAMWGIQVGGRYSFESGRPYGRQIIVRGMGAGQGDVTILANTRGTYALPAVNDFQIRLDKDVRLPGAQRLRFSVDFLNIFNSDTVLTLRNNSSQVTATTPWQQTLSVVRPRTVQLGVRYEF